MGRRVPYGDSVTGRHEDVLAHGSRAVICSWRMRLTSSAAGAFRQSQGWKANRDGPVSHPRDHVTPHCGNLPGHAPTRLCRYSLLSARRLRQFNAEGPNGMDERSEGVVHEDLQSPQEDQRALQGH